MAAGDTVMTNAFPTTWASSAVAGGFKFNLKAVKPPGYTGRGGNETTHMGSLAVTMAPKKLATFTPVTLRVAYSVNGLYQQLQAARGVNALNTIPFPDAGDGPRAVNFWGWIESVEPAEHSTDDPEPQANVTVMVSNRNAAQADTLPYLT